MYTSQGGKFFKVVDVNPEARTDPVEMEIANAYMISHIIDRHSARTPQYIGATRACIAKRAGSLGFALTPCSTLRNVAQDRVAVVYRDINMRAASDQVFRTAVNAAPEFRDSAVRTAALPIALFCAWFREKSVTYNFRHNDMHATNVAYDTRERTLKLIDWGRTSIGNYELAKGDSAIAEIRAVMGESNTFDYAQEVQRLIRKWPHIRHNLFPKNRDAGWDRPWAPDLTMFLACIAFSLFSVWTAYPEVGVRYSRGKHTFVLAEVLDDEEMHRRIDATFRAPRTNPLYLLVLGAMQAVAYKLRSGRAGRDGPRLRFEDLTAYLTDTEYTAVVVNVERAIDMRASYSVNAANEGAALFGGGASDATSILSYLFPTSLGEAADKRNQRRADERAAEGAAVDLEDEEIFEDVQNVQTDQTDQPDQADQADPIDDATATGTHITGYRNYDMANFDDDYDNYDNYESDVLGDPTAADDEAFGGGGGGGARDRWIVPSVACAALAFALSVVGGFW